MDKLRGVWDEIKRINEADIENRLQKNAFVNALSVKFEIFTQQDPDELFGNKLKASLKDLLLEMCVDTFDVFQDYCDVTKSGHRYLMCLYICGYIESDEMPLSKLDLDVNNRYTQMFLQAILPGTDYTYRCIDTVDSVLQTELGERNKDKIIPADLCIINESHVTKEECVLDVWRPTSDSARYNIEVWPVFFTLSLGLKVEYGCYGVTSAEGASYLFLYNLPDWNTMKSKNKDANWQTYIENPITMYIASMNALGLTTDRWKHFISRISTGVKFDYVYLYVHLLVMTSYTTGSEDSSSPRFYVRLPTRDNEDMKFIQTAFYLNGMKYDSLKPDLVFNSTADDDDQPFSYNPPNPDRERAITSLAVYYLDMMQKNNIFHAPRKGHEFFPIEPYRTHEDLYIGGNHPIMYDWVFRDVNLKPDDTWQSRLPVVTTDDWKKIGLCRRVYHAMWENIQKMGQDAKSIVLHENADNFLKKLTVNANVRKGNDAGQITFDLERAYKNKNLRSNDLKSFIQQLDDSIQDALNGYFRTLEYTASDLAYKYVMLKENGEYIVLDSHDTSVDMKDVPDDESRKADSNDSDDEENDRSINVSMEPDPRNIKPPDDESTAPSVSSVQGNLDSDGTSDASSQSSATQRLRNGMSTRSGNGTNNAETNTRKDDTLQRLIENLGKVTTRHAYEIAERKKKLESLNDLTDKKSQKEREEHERIVKEIEKLEEDLRKSKNDVEKLVTEKETLEKQLATANETATAQDEVINGLNEKIRDLEKQLRDLEEKMTNREAELLEQIRVIQEENDDLKRQIEELNGDNGKSKSEIDSLREQIQQLTDENTSIKQLKDSGEQASTTALETLQQENENLKNEIEDLKAAHDDTTNELVEMKNEFENENKKLNRQLSRAEDALKQATKDMDKEVHEELKAYDSVMQAGMTMVITEEMRKMLRDGDFKGFGKAVRIRPSKRERFSNAALFLVLESMAGTWKTAVDAQVTLQEGQNYDEIIIQKIIYDLREWDSIENEGKANMRYTSRYFKEFVAAFGLAEEDGDVGGGGGGSGDEGGGGAGGGGGGEMVPGDEGGDTGGGGGEMVPGDEEEDSGDDRRAAGGGEAGGVGKAGGGGGDADGAGGDSGDEGGAAKNPSMWGRVRGGVRGLFGYPFSRKPQKPIPKDNEGDSDSRVSNDTAGARAEEEQEDGGASAEVGVKDKQKGGGEDDKSEGKSVNRLLQRRNKTPSYASLRPSPPTGVSKPGGRNAGRGPPAEEDE